MLNNARRERPVDIAERRRHSSGSTPAPSIGIESGIKRRQLVIVPDGEA